MRNKNRSSTRRLRRFARVRADEVELPGRLLPVQRIEVHKFICILFESEMRFIERDERQPVTEEFVATLSAQICRESGRALLIIFEGAHPAGGFFVNVNGTFQCAPDIVWQVQQYRLQIRGRAEGSGRPSVA